MKIQNERGIITVDYLFSLILVGGFCFIIFALSLTLTVTEMVQYATFASARAFYSANKSEQEQQQAAGLKFNELTQTDAIGPLLNSGWFEVKDFYAGSSIPETVPALSGLKGPRYDETNSTFHGAVVYLSSKVLEFNIPFYGSTVDDSLRGGNDFGSYVTSFLGREVTEVECLNFVRQRWEKIKSLPTTGSAPYSQAQHPSAYVGMVDNGC